MKNLNKKLSFGVALAMTSAILSCVPSVSASAVDSLNYPTDKDYDFHEVLEHYANDEQGNRQLVQEDIYYNFQSIYTGTYSLYERGYSYVFVTTNGKADKEELENELGKEVTAFSYYVGDKQYVYNYSKNEDYEKVYNIDGVEKVELARSKFS